MAWTSGTKAEIFTVMRDLAAQGYAILFYSTDLAELANVADRTLVLSYGRVAIVLAGQRPHRGPHPRTRP